MTYETILVPVDGSDCSLRAAEEARTIAEAYDAAVELLSVVDVRSYGLSTPEAGMPTAAVEEALVEHAEDALDDAEAVLEGRSVESEVRHGVPVEAVVEYAEEVAADLVVMGTHGHTGMERIALGSVAEGVLREAPAPVVTVREDVERERYDRILVPTDGSEHAEAAFDHAVDVADRFDADLRVLVVVDPEEIGGWFNAGGLSEEFVERHEEKARENARRLLGRAEDAGVDAETTVLEGAPHEEIVAYAEDEAVDLIAMGTHGRSGVARVLLGSVTESVVRNAACPVLSVRARSE
ncbi:MAG: universal stress protein [Halanaeroarchaeum sp.]